MMKFFKFLLISVFLVMFSSSAYALNFGIDINADGDLDFGYDNEVLETGHGAVALNFDATSLAVLAALTDGASGSFSGSFTELAGGYIPVIDLGNSNAEMTYMLSATGNFTVDYSYTTAGGLTLTNHAFGFTDGTIDIYADDTRDWSGGSAPVLADDGLFYGSNDGDVVATFNLINGSGTLQVATGASDSVDIWSLSTSIEENYFFFEPNIDFASVILQAGIFIEMYVNTSNELEGYTLAQFMTEVEDAVESGLFPEDGYTFLLGVETDGSIEFGVVPEPATMVLFGLGLLGLAGISRKRTQD